MYLYPDPQNATLFDPQESTGAPGGRRPNLAPDFIAACEAAWGLRFQPHPPAPSPNLGEGEQEWESEGERSRGGTRCASPGLWAKLKPLARQMRHEPTPAEDVLWQAVRNRKIAGVKFRRQHVIKRFIVDFYAADPGLVIEVDGPIHDYTREEDALRQAYLESLGLRVIRFTNDQVLHNMDVVLREIEATIPPLRKVERGPGGEVFTPEDVFHYAYAVFHSPTYRRRYAQVERYDGSRVGVSEFLDLVRHEVAAYAIERILGAAAETTAGEAASYTESQVPLDQPTQFYLLWRWGYGEWDVPDGEAVLLSVAVGIDLKVRNRRNEFAAHIGVAERRGRH